MVKDDLSQFWAILSGIFSTIRGLFSNLLNFTYYVMGRIQYYLAYFLRIPAAYSGFWRGIILSLVGTLTSKVVSMPGDIEAYTRSLSHLNKRIVHGLSVTLFFVCALINWPLMQGVSILPLTPLQVMPFILLGPCFFMLRSMWSFTQDYLPGSIREHYLVGYLDAFLVTLSCFASWGLSQYLSYAAPVSGWLYTVATAASFGWSYFKHPPEDSEVLRYSSLVAVMGPILGYLAILIGFGVSAALSVFTAFYLGMYALFPFYFEIGLIIGAVAAIALCTYALFREVSLVNWCRFALLCLFLPPATAFVCFLVPIIFLFALQNTWLLFMVIANVATVLLVVGVRWFDKFLQDSAQKNNLSAVRAFSLLTMLYSSVFFVLYGFCFTFPYLATQSVWSIALAVYMAGISILSTVYVIEYVVDMLIKFDSYAADPDGVRAWMGTALLLGIAGNVGVNITVISWVPIVITNVIAGALLGLGAGLLTASMSVLILHKFFPRRVNMSNLYRCTIAGMVMVGAPYGIWYLCHFSFNTISLSLVFLKVMAMFRSIQVFREDIPRFFYPGVLEISNNNQDSTNGSSLGGNPGQRMSNQIEECHDNSSVPPPSAPDLDDDNTGSFGGGYSSTYKTPSAPFAPDIDVFNPVPSQSTVQSEAVTTDISALPHSQTQSLDNNLNSTYSGSAVYDVDGDRVGQNGYTTPPPQHDHERSVMPTGNITPRRLFREIDQEGESNADHMQIRGMRFVDDEEALRRCRQDQ
ncbi:MAG: hypothetical protein VX112_03840 [Pseudomonadota bacterium]|nr:hypothetical protein [Pseudomonadota bacterium]